jgi:hypothetical protein
MPKASDTVNAELNAIGICKHLRLHGLLHPNETFLSFDCLAIALMRSSVMPCLKHGCSNDASLSATTFLKTTTSISLNLDSPVLVEVLLLLLKL